MAAEMEHALDCSADQENLPAANDLMYSSLKSICNGDETFQALVNCFCANGRGRPPNPPTGLRLTNKLLLQLYQLKMDYHKTYADVSRWFEKLFPDVNFPSKRIMGVVDQTVKQFQLLQRTGGNTQDFLGINRDLDFVSKSLSALGIRRSQLLNIEDIGPASSPITNEVVVDLEHFRTNEKRAKQFTVQVLKKMSGYEKITEYSVKKIIATYKTLKSKDKLSVFLASNFPPPTVPTKDPPVQNASKELHTELYKLSQQNCELSGKNSTLQQHISVLKETVCDLSVDKMGLLKAADENIKEDRTLEDKLRARTESLEKKTDAQRKTCSALNKKLEHQKEHIRTLQSRIMELTEENEKTKTELEKERRKNVCLLQDNSQLEKDIDILAQRTIQTKLRHENNRYSDEIRKTVMRLQSEANVPANKCAKVIQVVSETIFDYHFQDKDLPCLQTAINIADEAHVLSKLQIVESILQVNNCTLHTDGTSRDQKKVVSQQMTLDTGETFSFGFHSVATEDAATLLEVTIMQLEEITELYSAFNEEPEARDDVFKELLRKITSLMSDRAAVMKKFDSEFQQFIQTELGCKINVHFVFCNAHLLLGLARSLETGLAEFEKKISDESGEKFGRDMLGCFAMFNSTKETATSRLIRTACDIAGPRPDEKNGCRQEWLAYCEEREAKSYMTSYRSNRFNAFFEGAAAILHHRTMLQDLVATLGHSNLKIQSVAADLADQKLMVLVAAVALLYLRLTGPYWELLHSKVKYTELHQYIRPMTVHMDEWTSDASSLLDPEFPGVFPGGQFELGPEKESLRQSVYHFIQDEEISRQVKMALEHLMDPLFSVTLRQLGDFLEGGVYGGPPAVFPEGLEHCPLTNLLGENVFGDFDFDLGKRRHASMHFRSGIHMAAHNKTGYWISQKDPVTSPSLMAFSRKKGKDLRRQHCQQEKMVMLRVQEKLAENARLKTLREAKQAETKTTLTRRVAAHGGPCRDSSDVDLLIRRLRQESASVLLEALKNEIRFQKVVLQRKGNLFLSGSIEDLAAALQAHLGGTDEHHEASCLPGDDEDDTENQVPHKRRRLEHDEEEEEDADQFIFANQGQWVAVYYDDRYYIGQVLTVISPQKAMVSYMEQCSTDGKTFKWPRREEVAETAAYFVFHWDFEVLPVGSQSRSWEVMDIAKISTLYENINDQC